MSFRQVEEVMALAREAYRDNWWVLQGVKANSYPALESEAAGVHNFELAVVPGILQTEHYAAALFTLDNARDRDRNLAIRMNRVARLTAENPLTVHAVIDESALHRPIGGPKVQKAQLGHLVALSDLPSITVQVLHTSAGTNLGLRGGFSVLSFPPSTIDDLGYLDHAAGNLQLAKTADVKELRLRFDSIASVAMTEGDSVALLSRLAND